MTIAVISDVHGNLEALTAVLEDIDSQNVGHIYCLGDTIGYGPNPVECFDLVRENSSVWVCGNHDEAALYGGERFSSVASQAIEWTRDQLDKADAGLDVTEQRTAHLAQLPMVFREQDRLFVHSSPMENWDYIFPEVIYRQYKMDAIFARIPATCFVGHTHIPGVFHQDDFLTIEDVASRYHQNGRKLLINVGSVGQPRDGDPRACYVLLDDKMTTFRRVSYDFDKTASKIYAISELDNMLGDRLKSGR